MVAYVEEMLRVIFLKTDKEVCVLIGGSLSESFLQFGFVQVNDI